MDLSDLRIIDAHIHQWDPLATPRDFSHLARLFRYLPVPIHLAAKLARRSDREFVGDPTAYAHPYLPADYRADAVGVPVAGVAHIEVDWSNTGPTAKADETRWVASLPFGVDTPRLTAILGSADPAAPGFPELLDAHQTASPLFRGIRTMVAHHPDPGVRQFAPTEDALTSSAFLDGFAELVRRGLVFEAWVYSNQLPQVTGLAKRYPEATIVLDHLATPVGLFGRIGKHTGRTPEDRRDLLLRWQDDLAALAELPGLAGVVLAKTEHGEQVDATAARLPGGLPIVALVESAAGLEASGEIAGRPATTRLAFGSGDFRRDTGIARDPAVLAYPRCRLTVASRAAGLPGPVDGPTVGADPALLRSETADAAAAGMTGRLCLRAEHTAVVNDLLSPSPDEIASATALLRRYRAGGPRDGSDAPRLARAEQVVALARVFARDAVTARR
ncbi:aldolase/citrate lyase family protein [Nocardia farcinica]|uniref:aldolase/citrate lyase family protein n=1 Tax=Nocardia farcinica TaxID=37329 RepID=UPI00245453C2|nr:aldolase/citrate lyase family protein [Nocardia farcinica]